MTVASNATGHTIRSGPSTALSRSTRKTLYSVFGPRGLLPIADHLPDYGNGHGEQHASSRCGTSTRTCGRAAGFSA